MNRFYPLSGVNDRLPSIRGKDGLLTMEQTLANALREQC